MSAPSKDDVPLKPAPECLDLEQGLLGALLTNNALVERIEGLTPGHFYDPVHARIFEAALAEIAAGRMATHATLSVVLAGLGVVLRDETIDRYLRRLVTLAAVSPSIADYARLIRDCAMRRALILIGEDMIERSRNLGHGDADSIIQEAEAGLCDIAEAGYVSTEVGFDNAIEQAVVRINTAIQAGGRLTGLSTGLADVDAKLGGLQPTDLIILAGRPAMGKTALATNLSVNVASAGAGNHVHFFSQEMSAEQLASRILSDRVNIPSDLLRRGRVSDEQMRDVVLTSAGLKSLPITVDEMGGISLAQLSAKARRIKRRRDTSLIVIDYLQLMSGAGSRRSENRVQEITAITTGLKALAKELRVPIVALSQLSRKVEDRVDKRPQLADLRESGSIEQDADVVLFVFRDDYYLDREQPPDIDENGLPNPKFGEWRARMNDATGKAEVIVAKHRHGPTGIIRLAFDARVTRFSDLAHPEQGQHHAHRR